LGHSLRMPWLSVLVSVGLAFGAWLLVQEVPREYAPEEDQGQFTAQLQAPEGMSFEQMSPAGMKAASYMEPYFETGVVRRGVRAVPGWGNSAGIVNVALQPWDERTISTQDLLQELNKGWVEIPEVRISAFRRGGGGGGGGGGQPVQIVLGGPTYDELARWRDIIIDRAAENPGLIRMEIGRAHV